MTASLLCAIAMLMSVPSGASAGTVIARPATTTLAPNGATSAVDGLSVVNSDGGEALQVTLATSAGTLSLTPAADVTLTPGNSWSGSRTTSFVGTRDDVNATLSSTTITTTGVTAGTTAKLSLTALSSDPNYVYSPSNGHFYRYVASAGIDWGDALTSAAAASFRGQAGYLGTIPDASVNNVVRDKLSAENVWVAGQATNDPSGDPFKRVWKWVTGDLAGQPFTNCTTLEGVCDFAADTGLYHAWQSGAEPNNAGGTETAVAINYVGTGDWNDYQPTDDAVTGYIVEYGDTNGAKGFAGVSDATTDVLIDQAPGVPTAPSGARGDGEATVRFTAPASNPGSVPTSYTVTASPGGEASTCSAVRCVVNGLTNGTEYSVTVRANNAAGSSSPSTPTLVTPSTAPAAPTGLTASRGNGAASVAFTAPSENGGAAVTSYTIVSSPGGAIGRCSGSPCEIVGLANGTAYTFTGYASNVAGDSAASAPSGAVTPATTPGKPSGVGAVRDDFSVTLSFSAPSSNGAAITAYTVAISGADPATQVCTSSPCLIAGLTNGVPYTFTVSASNDVGTGSASESVGATPATVSDAPGVVTTVRRSGQVSVSFSVPAFDGGTPVTGYEASTDGGQDWVELETSAAGPGTRRATIDGLGNGVEYEVLVRAVNAVGVSPSAGSGTFVPAAVPAAPDAVTATRGAGEATVSFDTPADNGAPITSYTVRSFPGGVSESCLASPCVIDGLTNGTAYAFTVTAMNDVGASPASTPSTPVTPAAVLDAPRDLTATTGGNAAITVTFKAPSTDEKIYGYESSLDGGQSWQPLAVSGSETLTGVIAVAESGAYVVKVRARSDLGAGRVADSSSVSVLIAQREPKQETKAPAVEVSTPSTALPGPPAVTPPTIKALPSIVRMRLKSTHIKTGKRTRIMIALRAKATVKFTIKRRGVVARFERRLKAGSTSVTLNTRLGKVRLKPGLYELIGQAVTKDGVGPKEMVRFRVVRRAT